ncbi:hypothetical protein LTR84_005662 [Exophiala bonariae]|uniref:F-box domain-containing protein n=1 Tax=Exophiala bonariae TaxID=1690606 RepID=A0AAV9N2X9_9EURO|nr:hypothetical protein LTR84_005662 [Exophiala bonariae]
MSIPIDYEILNNAFPSPGGLMPITIDPELLSEIFPSPQTLTSIPVDPEILDDALPSSERPEETARKALAMLAQNSTPPQIVITTSAGSSSNSTSPILKLRSKHLLHLTRHLAFQDILSLIKTCKYIYEAIKGATVERVHWAPGKEYPTVFSPDDLIKVVNGGFLANITLAPKPASYSGFPVPGPHAEHVMKLYMGAFCQANCDHTAACGLSYRLFRQLIGLKDLTINMDLFKGHFDALILPVGLLTLRLYEDRYSLTRKKVCQTLSHIRHAKLRHLSLTNINLRQWTTHDLDLRVVSIGNALNFPALETLALHNVSGRMSVLWALFNVWRNAKKLWFDHDLKFPGIVNPDPNDRFDFARFPDVLLPLKDTLVELYLTHVPEDHPNVLIPNSFPGLIRHLHDFSNLKRLSIDPALFIGIHVCPRFPLPLTGLFRGTGAFAGVLPTQLEVLALIINREQVQRVALPAYRSELVECILGPRRQEMAFMNLKRLDLVEDIYYAPGKKCKTT